jgi:hypothetical protein
VRQTQWWQLETDDGRRFWARRVEFFGVPKDGQWLVYPDVNEYIPGVTHAVGSDFHYVLADTPEEAVAGYLLMEPSDR